MPIYYVQWDVEPTHTPQNPKERLDSWIMMTQWIIADISAGIMTSWGRCSGETCGYAITSDVTPQELDELPQGLLERIRLYRDVKKGIETGAGWRA